MSKFCAFVDNDFNCKVKKKKECNYTIENCEECNDWRFWIDEETSNILQKNKQTG